jgi:hypothetical protein
MMGYKKRKRLKTKDPLPFSVAVLFLVVGLLVGGLFIFGQSAYWLKPVSREEAVEVSATFRSYRIRSVGRGSHEVDLTFFDRDTLVIDTYMGEDMLDAVRSLEEGTMLQMLVHPHTDSILEMRAGDDIILSFADSHRTLLIDSVGFAILGAACYALAALGLGSLIKRQIQPVRK